MQIKNTKPFLCDFRWIKPRGVKKPPAGARISKGPKGPEILALNISDCHEDFSDLIVSFIYYKEFTSARELLPVRWSDNNWPKFCVTAWHTNIKLKSKLHPLMLKSILIPNLHLRPKHGKDKEIGTAGQKVNYFTHCIDYKLFNWVQPDRGI